MAKYRKLGRPSSHRNLMLRNMTTSLLKHGHMQTTVARAKEIRKFAESMITLGKRGDLHARRQALAFLTEEAVVAKLFGEIAEKYKERTGGYTRIVQTGPRRGDAAPMCKMELV
ncbi:MAG: 50S ribosomal protein L17 [Bacillota bacterium]|nr:50S ribosomal protein L17 [Bacillota bacterium]